MKPYKQLLLDHLQQNGWELISHRKGEDWWIEEQWQIRSVKQNWGYELAILFLNNPYSEGNERPTVNAVIATTKVPTSLIKTEHEVARVELAKGRLDEKLTHFIHELEQHRDNAY